MEYRTVFDIAQAGHKVWRFPSQGLIFVVIGVFLILFRRRLPHWGRTSSLFDTAFPFAFFGFAVAWTLVSFVSTYRDYTALRRTIEDGGARVVEGVVSEFRPMPFEGHTMERFCVKDKCFEYSDYVITGAFNKTRSHGGPIQLGLPVRVTFVGTCIVKLEIAK